MCGSTNLIKKDGVFVCQSCGTQYSVEEAKKMMVEGTIDVKGTVKVDTSDELKNLYEIARRAKDSDNSENAAKYYDMILSKDPQSWEANFYVVYFKAKSCKIGQIYSESKNLCNSMNSVFLLVKNSITEENEQKKVVEELSSRYSSIANTFFSVAKSHIKNNNSNLLSDASESIEILYKLGDSLDMEFGGKYSELSTNAWKNAIEFNNEFLKYTLSPSQEKERMRECFQKIVRYDESYQAPAFKTPLWVYAVAIGVITIIFMVAMIGSI